MRSFPLWRGDTEAARAWCIPRKGDPCQHQLWMGSLCLFPFPLLYCLAKPPPFLWSFHPSAFLCNEFFFSTLTRQPVCLQICFFIIYFVVLLYLLLTYFPSQAMDKKREQSDLEVQGEKKASPLFFYLHFSVYWVHGEESKEGQIKTIRKQYFKGAQLIFRGCRRAPTNTPTRSTLIAQPLSAKVTVAYN